MKRRLTRYTAASSKLTRTVTLAVLTDLHNGPWEDLLALTAGCDAVLIVGDVPNRHKPGLQNALPFLSAMGALPVPVFYVAGNHEWLSGTWHTLRDHASQCGIHVLDNTYMPMGELVIGGMTSAPRAEADQTLPRRLAAQNGYRLLLCHHPEWYPKMIQDTGVDLTVSGHAHGGQIELFGHGLYAPGQGIFPRYTAGFYDHDRLLVSRGLTNSSGMPRWGNPCEAILLTLCPGRD